MAKSRDILEHIRLVHFTLIVFCAACWMLFDTNDYDRQIKELGDLKAVCSRLNSIDHRFYEQIAQDKRPYSPAIHCLSILGKSFQVSIALPQLLEMRRRLSTGYDTVVIFRAESFRCTNIGEFQSFWDTIDETNAYSSLQPNSFSLDNVKLLESTGSNTVETGPFSVYVCNPKSNNVDSSESILLELFPVGGKIGELTIKADSSDTSKFVYLGRFPEEITQERFKSFWGGFEDVDDSVLERVVGRSQGILVFHGYYAAERIALKDYLSIYTMVRLGQGTFGSNFPALDNLTAEERLLPLDTLEAMLKAKLKIGVEPLKAFGMEIPGRRVYIWGKIIISVILIYFGFHLREGRRQLKIKNKSNEIFTWVGAYPEVFAQWMVFLTLLVLPTWTAYNITLSTYLWTGSQIGLLSLVALTSLWVSWEYYTFRKTLYGSWIKFSKLSHAT